MHIIVDIRTNSSQEILPVRAGVAWATFWKKYKKDDLITFLVYEHQEKIEGYDTLIVAKPFGVFGKKRLKPKSSNQVFRSLNFSSFGRYDSTIPTISHIWSNAVKLYGDPTQNALVKRYNDWKRRIVFKESTGLIVPDIQIGRELVEIYDIGEEKIEIIPYLPVSEFSGEVPLHNIPTHIPFFIYDGGYGNEANILGLLSAWERYRDKGGTYELLLLGPAMDGLSALTQTIRSLDLTKSVRYLGALDDATMHTLYKKAKGWIYTGPYYSAGLTIEYARIYQLPLLLADITAFEEYAGIKVHPNHVLDITQGLHTLENVVYTTIMSHPEMMYIHAYEKILSKK